MKIEIFATCGPRRKYQLQAEADAAASTLGIDKVVAIAQGNNRVGGPGVVLCLLKDEHLARQDEIVDVLARLWGHQPPQQT